MEKYQGIVKDQMGTMDTLKTRICDTYKGAHDAAETLCKKTMGDRGTIDINTITKTSTTRRFYSVKYRNWGADSAGMAWFDNKEDADKFYDSRDYVDSPVEHQARSAKTIAEYEELCQA